MWQELNTPEDLEAALDRQAERPVLLFKHSTRCPISARALREAEAWLARRGHEVTPCRILVIERRPVSNLAAERLGIRHESPQAILLRAGEPVWHASHLSIQSSALDTALDAALDHALRPPAAP